MFTATHTNPREFVSTQINPIFFTATHTNPREFVSTQRLLPTWLTILSINVVGSRNSNYALEAPVTCKVNLHNKGQEGSKSISWELINDSNVPLSSGEMPSGDIFHFGSTWLTEIITPAFYSRFRIRAKIGVGDWVYSGYAYSLPVNLSVQTVSAQVSNSYGSLIPCSIHLLNGGNAGSQTIEWEVINYSNNSIVYSSGTQISENVTSFGEVDFALNGVYAPSGPDKVLYIRARIVGSLTWIYSGYTLNHVLTPPANPTPRG